MANPIWTTGQGQREIDLGTVTEGSYFEYPIAAYDPNGGPVSFKFLAGQLPPGIRISSNSASSSGTIQGGPYLNNVSNETSNYTFSLRAVDQNGLVSDKSFAMTIANVNPPIITTPANLGEVFDGSFFSLQLEADEFNPDAILTWAISSGSLPTGVEMSSSGLISGFVIPISNYTSLVTEIPATQIVQGTAYVILTLGTTNFLNFGATSNSEFISFIASRNGTINDGSGTVGELAGFGTTPFNEYGYEPAPQYQNNNYTFTVTVFDGANYASSTYSLSVIAKGQFTADSSYITDDNTYLTIDHDNVYVPILTTPSQTLPEVRSNSKFAFQFQGVDPAGNELSYGLSLSSGAAGFDQGGTQGFDTTGFDQENLSAPPGLIMDPTTGWFSGTVGAQPQAIQTYNFQVYTYETNDVSLQSVPVTYTLNILGDITNTINWSTSGNLGIIDNGSVSELYVSAVNNSGRELSYSLVSDGSELPQGLQLNEDGLIVGRAGFEFFELDEGTTTIDGIVSSFDNLYNFTIQATTTDGTSSSQASFSVFVNNYNSLPYENLYIKALPSIDQRDLFLSIVNNTDIFPTELLYRASDLNFGVARDIRSLFLAGLNPTEISTYLSAMTTNTYTKRIEFGDIKTAIAVDANFNTKYEVVYIELEPDYVYSTTSSTGVLDTKIDQTVYTNSFANMSNVISNAVGFENIGALPDWMTSPQANKQILGFTRAIVLAYTVPGASKLIAYRLGANGISFNEINFLVDRYDLDNSYSANYNISTQLYDLGEETTFDRIERTGVVATGVDYGVSGLAFNMINNQTVSQINSLGGLDGVTDFQSGDTLVFLQQENYVNETAQYDGWVYPNGSIIPGWNEFTNSVKFASTTTGFPSNPILDQVALVNNVYYMFVSELDKNGNILDTVWKTANLRANVWAINIDSNNIVTLTPVTFLRTVGIGTSASQITSMIIPNDQLQINYGETHSESISLYNTALTLGETVPRYINVPTMLAPANENTRFDGYGTRFINNRISYENPEVGDNWLIFPSTGPLL
jgi:hypothetical protein